MALTLGKRKRKAVIEEPRHDSESEEDLRVRFQRAFEAKFRPLAKSAPKISRIELEADDDDDAATESSDWSGISDEGGELEVVDFKAANTSFPDMDRSEQRSFMSSKPPTVAAKAGATKVKQKGSEESDTAETANLKHDLALQRLLKESHLLDPSSFSGKAPAPEGKGRLKALDMRLQGLGAKSSLTTQQKMPMAHRKGIQSKATDRETKRRKDAADNGVILEKARHVAKDMNRRERSVGGPTVGKFRGGTLRLSGKDVRDIQGPSKQGKGKKGRR